MPHALSNLRALAARRRRDPEALARWRNERLRALVAHAYANTDFWKQTFDAAGVRPSDIQTESDLARLPVTQRGELHAAGVDVRIARGYDRAKLKTFYTSGSTGSPFWVYRTAREDLWLNFLMWLDLRDMGVRLTDRRTRLLSIRQGRPAGVSRLRRAFMRAGLFHLDTANAREPIENMARRAAAARPDVIIGYSNAVLMLSEFTRDHGLPIHPRLAITGAETCTASMLARIAANFQCEALDMYGSWEYSNIGWQCPVSREYHLAQDRGVIEILKDGRPAREGEIGEMVVTPLHTFSMPLIRVSLRDLVVRGSDRCPCGAAFATIRSLEGRTVDNFIMPSGRTVRGPTITSAVFSQPWVLQYQLTQERVGQIVLHIRPAGAPPEGGIEALRAGMLAAIRDEPVECEVRLCEETPIQGGSKFRTYYCAIGPNGAAAENSAQGDRVGTP